MSVELSPPRLDDADAVAALFNEHALAFTGAPETDGGDVRNFWTGPELDLERDVLLAWEDGRLAGYGDVSRHGGRSYVDVRVRPDAPIEIAGSLVERMEERFPEAPPRAFAFVQESEWRGLLESRGYKEVRRNDRMIADFDEPPSPPVLSEGIRIRTFEPADERAVYEVANDSFADHWGFHPRPFEEWRHHMIGVGDFDPSVWFLAEEGDELVGVCLCRPHQPGDEGLGWVMVLGVLVPWRRRGIASGLLLHAFGEFHRRGLGRAGLGVDAQSTTGALELYSGVGMRPYSESVVYDLDR